jgi:hypothetical protein
MEFIIDSKNIKNITVENKDINTIKYLRYYNKYNQKEHDLNIDNFEKLKDILYNYKLYFPNLENIIIDEGNLFKNNKNAKIYYNLIVDPQIKLLKLFDDNLLIIKNNNNVKIYGSRALEIFENDLPDNITEIFLPIHYRFQNVKEIIADSVIPIKYNNLPLNLKSINLLLDYGYSEDQFNYISIYIKKGNLLIPNETNINLYLRLQKFKNVPCLKELRYDSDEIFYLKYLNVNLDHLEKLQDNIFIDNVEKENYYYTIKKEFYDNDENIMKMFCK